MKKNLQNSFLFFKENGYLILKNVLKKSEIIEINNILKTLEKKQKNNGRGLSEPGIKKSLVHSLHKENKIKKLVFEKKWYTDTCKKLIKSAEIITWNCKSNLKKKWHGSAEYYHQDYEYWRGYGFKNSNMISCMLFLDKHNHENGGMWIFPKSHKKHYKHIKFLNINSLQKNLIPSSTLDKLSKKTKPIKLNEEPGSCIFFHCKLIHGSAHNISQNDRKILLAQIANYNSYKNVNIKKIDSQNSNKRKIYERKELMHRLKKLNYA